MNSSITANQKIMRTARKFWTVYAMRKKPKFLFDFSNCKSGKVSGLKTPVSTRAELFWLCVYRLKDHFKTILKYFELFSPYSKIKSFRKPFLTAVTCELVILSGAKNNQIFLEWILSSSTCRPFLFRFNRLLNGSRCSEQSWQLRIDKVWVSFWVVTIFEGKTLECYSLVIQLVARLCVERY